MISSYKLPGERIWMATRQSIEDCLQQCEAALRSGLEQYREGAKQEHYGDLAYTDSQGLLQEALNDVDRMWESCNHQQREQLHRMRLQLQQMQNNMILLSH
ncbi:Protein of unknown function [Bacillus sp. OV322]|nr:Protein of unknown function [Bacillus sp. OV322]